MDHSISFLYVICGLVNYYIIFIPQIRIDITSNPLFVNRPFKITLPAAQYNFSVGETSILNVTVNFNKAAFSNQVGVFWAFDVGGDEYFTFANDFNNITDNPNGMEIIGEDTRRGMFTYPSCDSPDSVSGDASTLLSGGADFGTKLRKKLADGNENNWYPLTHEVGNGQTSSVEFQIINKYLFNEYEFEFNSKTEDEYTFNPPLGCKRSSSLPNGKDFNLYLAIDVACFPQTLEITSICVKKYVKKSIQYVAH